MNKTKLTAFALTILLALFASLELISRIFILPGSSDYIEKKMIEQGLARKKAPGEYRIFLFGEPTMSGDRIKFYLKDLLPEEYSRRVTINDFTGPNVTSAVARQSFAETASYKPDMAVFYVANNDYILPESRAGYIFSPAPVEKIRNLINDIPKHSSLINFFRRIYISRNPGRPEKAKKAPEGTAGHTALEPGSVIFTAIRKGFESNMEAIIREAGRRSIRVIIFEGVYKWKGREPVKSVHEQGLTADALSLWDDTNGTAGELFGAGDFEGALSMHEECLAIDGVYALTYYRIGECHEKLGDLQAANRYYRLANDMDRLPIRGPSVVNDFYEKIRGDAPQGVDIIRTGGVFEENSPGKIIGDDLMTDHIHPTEKGRAIIALEIVKTLYREGLAAPKSVWRWDRLRNPEAPLNLY